MSKTRNYITWALTVLMALIFLGAGFAKVTGQEAMVQAFTVYELPTWFRIAIGGVEIIGGIFLIIPAFSGMASFGLSIIMIGAIATHAMYDPASKLLTASVLFIILTYIYLTRKNVIPPVLQKHLIG